MYLLVAGKTGLQPHRNHSMYAAFKINTTITQLACQQSNSTDKVCSLRKFTIYLCTLSCSTAIMQINLFLPATPVILPACPSWWQVADSYYAADTRVLLSDVLQTLNKLGDRSFSAAGPWLQNDLPPGLRRLGLTFDSFGQFMKSHLFGDWST